MILRVLRLDEHSGEFVRKCGGYAAYYDYLKEHKIGKAVFKCGRFYGIQLHGKTFVRGPGIKIGRNEKCPCGSGDKYKKCCMKKRAQQT